MKNSEKWKIVAFLPRNYRITLFRESKQEALDMASSLVRHGHKFVSPSGIIDFTPPWQMTGIKIYPPKHRAGARTTEELAPSPN